MAGAVSRVSRVLMTGPLTTIPTVTIKRSTTTEGGIEQWIIVCPHCAREHVHGAGEGHRVAHCLGGNPGYFLVSP